MTGTLATLRRLLTPTVASLPPRETVRSHIAYWPDGTPYLVKIHRCTRTGTVLRVEHCADHD